MKALRYFMLFALVVSIFSCDEDLEAPQLDRPDHEDPEEREDSEEQIYYLPVVIHILHNGEAIGEGPNLSLERIERQIDILNEDFRRKVGTRGYNSHPDGGDARMEFVMAKQDPNGKTINGINRIDQSDIHVIDLGYNQNHFAQYGYWNPAKYINIWTTPIPDGDSPCIVLGQSSGPDVDLPGSHLLPIPGANDAEGILINTTHFGISEIDCHARFGRTLTHEMGHYFGLLHPWGARDCEANDYCDDTPAVDDFVFGKTAYQGCRGEPIMIGNFMNFSDDEVMNIFTKDQIARMHYVINGLNGRQSLLTSHALLP